MASKEGPPRRYSAAAAAGRGALRCQDGGQASKQAAAHTLRAWVWMAPGGVLAFVLVAVAVELEH